MHLNQFTDIAIRSLIYLSQPSEQKKITIQELSKNLNVSKNHLVKVIHFLSQKQWVLTFRGKGGGVMINTEIQKYALGDLIQTLENHTDHSQELIDCKKSVCNLLSLCHLRPILNDALIQFYKHLNQYTLVDIIKDPTKIECLMKQK